MSESVLLRHNNDFAAVPEQDVQKYVQISICLGTSSLGIVLKLSPEPKIKLPQQNWLRLLLEALRLRFIFIFSIDIHIHIFRYIHV